MITMSHCNKSTDPTGNVSFNSLDFYSSLINHPAYIGFKSFTEVNHFLREERNTWNEYVLWRYTNDDTGNSYFAENVNRDFTLNECVLNVANTVSVPRTARHYPDLEKDIRIIYHLEEFSYDRILFYRFDERTKTDSCGVDPECKCGLVNCFSLHQACIGVRERREKVLFCLSYVTHTPYRSGNIKGTTINHIEIIPSTLIRYTHCCNHPLCLCYDLGSLLRGGNEVGYFNNRTVRFSWSVPFSYSINDVVRILSKLEQTRLRSKLTINFSVHVLGNLRVKL